MKLKIEVTDGYDKAGELRHWSFSSLVPHEGREEVMNNSAIQASQIARYFDLAKAIEKAIADFYSSISLTPIADRKEPTSDLTV